MKRKKTNVYFTSTPRGFTSVATLTGGKASWMEKRFQVEAREASAQLLSALQTMTKAELIAFIESANGQVFTGDKKADLVTRAHVVQTSAWYPEREV